ARHGAVDHAHGDRVELVVQDLDVLQVETQRHRLAELLGRDVPALDQDLTKLLAILAAGHGRRLDRLTRREPLLDDDVTDQLAGTRAPALLRSRGGGRYSGSGVRRRRTHAPDIGNSPR